MFGWCANECVLLKYLCNRIKKRAAALLLFCISASVHQTEQQQPKNACTFANKGVAAHIFRHNIHSPPKKSLFTVLNFLFIYLFFFLFIFFFVQIVCFI